MQCLYYLKLKESFIQSEPQTKAHHVVKIGYYFREFDKALIQRFRCKTCHKNFSTETLNPCRYQKKRFLNSSVYELMVSGVSQRRSAKILRVNKKTVVRKFLFLGRFALSELRKKSHLQNKKVSHLQFDDVETFEHTKCKPLSITLAVEEKSRFILGFRVSSMPAKGYLVKKALKKYGPRKDERKKARASLFKELKSIIVPSAIIKSDMNPHYSLDVKRYFKTQKHFVYKGRRGCVVGQGELKAGGFDPLFSFNHTAAMMRANINRLFRRTWCTTKKAMCLEFHIALYLFYHNYFLVNSPSD